MRSKLVIIFIGLYPLQLLAQADSAKSIVYYNTFTSGALIGCGNCTDGKDFSLSFLTMHGIAFPSGIKLGVGAGIDSYYDWRMIPLVAGITIDKGISRSAFYFHLHAGHSFGLYTVEQGEIPNWKERGGFIITPMLGYRMGYDRVRLYVQAGYKHQKAFTSFDYSQWGWSYKGEKSWELNRFVIQLGFGIN